MGFPMSHEAVVRYRGYLLKEKKEKEKKEKESKRE